MRFPKGRKKTAIKALSETIKEALRCLKRT